MLSWSGFKNERYSLPSKTSLLNREIDFLKLEILWLALYHDDWMFLLLPKKQKVGISAFQPSEPLFRLSIGQLNASYCSVVKSDDGICQFALLNSFFPPNFVLIEPLGHTLFFF